MILALFAYWTIRAVIRFLVVLAMACCLTLAAAWRLAWRR